MDFERPFQLLNSGLTANLVVTGTAQNLTLPTLTAAPRIAVRLANIGTQTVFIRDEGTVATVAAGMPLLPNTVEAFEFKAGTTLSAIAGATGSTLYATFGQGS